MQFACPGCGTRYNVDDEERLLARSGRVECYQCHEVFQLSGSGTGGPEGISKKSGKSRKLRKRDAEGLGTVEKVLTGIRPDDDTPGGVKPPEPLPVIPDQPYPIEETREQPESPPGRRGGIAPVFWGLGALVLLAGLAGQSLWHFRGHPDAHRVLRALCAEMDCEVPPLRRPEAFQVTERVFTRVPDQPDVLVLRLRLANGAAFPQPYPGVELRLYDSAQGVVGRGRVVPADYLAAATPDRLGPGELGEIELKIRDPGQEATGFEVAFF